MNETFEQCRKNLLRRGFEVRIAATTEEARQILREEMEGCVQYAVPLSTDVHIGKNWLEAH